MLIACRVEAMDESGAGDRSTAAKLTEKLKGEDVKKGETRVIFVGWIIKIFNYFCIRLSRLFLGVLQYYFIFLTASIESLG